MLLDQPLAKKFVGVQGKRIAYHERGRGQPILFLHGNPTSSYLWRNVISEVEGLGRLIAPDLIGMGDWKSWPRPVRIHITSSRTESSGWSFIDQVIGPTASILFVLHDWGSALGFDWANNHRDRVRGIAYMEAIVRPFARWHEWNPLATKVFQGFRSDQGEAMILERNLFVERVLFGSIIRKLTEVEMAEYRRPFVKSPPTGGQPLPGHVKFQLPALPPT